MFFGSVWNLFFFIYFLTETKQQYFSLQGNSYNVQTSSKIQSTTKKLHIFTFWLQTPIDSNGKSQQPWVVVTWGYVAVQRCGFPEWTKWVQMIWFKSFPGINIVLQPNVSICLLLPQINTWVCREQWYVSELQSVCEDKSSNTLYCRPVCHYWQCFNCW